MVVNLITNEEISFTYDAKAMSVNVGDLDFTLDQDSASQIDLVQLTW